jgi:outer membrane protein assembly factor BamB
LARVEHAAVAQQAYSVELDEIDGPARSQREQVQAYLTAGQWAEALLVLQQLMDNDGDRLVMLDAARHVTVRENCHRQIAALPQDALATYRRTVDSTAGRMYEEAMASRDMARLSAVVDDFFASRWGDDALWALGELALERGWYSAARAYWEQINPKARFVRSLPAGRMALADGRHMDAVSGTDVALPPGRDGSDAIAYPDSDRDVAEVRARLVLVSILEGAIVRAREEYQAFRELHPQARGWLRGREVNYAEALGSLIDAAPAWREPIPAADWPTFAGSPARNHPMAAMARVGARLWDEPILLSTVSPAANGKPQIPLPAAAPLGDPAGVNPLSCHPVVVGDLVLISGPSTISAYDLRTGRPAWGQEDAVIYRDERLGTVSASRVRPHLGTPRYTLTVWGGRLYARMGDVITYRAADRWSQSGGSHLVCLDLHAHGRLMWKVAVDDSRWAFEGAPISDGAHIYVAMRYSDVRPQAHVACYDATTGLRRWRRFICAGEAPVGGTWDEVTHHLLTLAEGSIYYNTNLGAVAALSAGSGRVRWMRRYAHQRLAADADERSLRSQRDLNPCVFHRGTLYVAPEDFHGIFALSAATGDMVWTNSLADDAVHLLGIARDTLIASGDRLWWIDAAGGKAVFCWPESTKSGVRGFGRGIIAGEEIYWPTRDTIHVLRADPSGTTRETQEPIHLDAYGAVGGNLVVAAEQLLIAGSENVYGLTGRPRPKQETRGELAITETGAREHDRGR